MRRTAPYTIIASIIAACVLLPSLALVPTEAAAHDLKSLRFQHLSREAGLSQSFVYAIVQDRQGFMWFGTQEGLNRFDGYEFVVFAPDPADPASISDETIRTIVEDRNGTLWVGTDAGGLSKFDAVSQTFTNYLHDPLDESSIADNRVRVVFEDSSGALWVGTDGSGLDRFNTESRRFEHFPHDPAVPSSLGGPHVWDILEHSDGTLWVATNNGLSRFDAASSSFTNYRHDPGDPSSISADRVRALCEDGDGSLWIGTETGGLNRLAAGSDTFERFVHDPQDASSISADWINTIYEDDVGVVWIGTVDGLNAWKPSSRHFERYAHDSGDRYSLAHDTVTSLYMDRGGVFWVGTYDGLNTVTSSARAMLHFKHNVADPDSLSEDFVTSFAEGTDGTLWVGTYGGGLNALDRESGRMSRIRHLPGDAASLSSDRVTALLVDSQGALWAGTRASGLNRLDGNSERFTRLGHDPEDATSLSADGVTYILENRRKDLWIATFGGGLNLLDRETGRFTSFRHSSDDPATISSDRILVLFEDSNETLWIGTYGGGLNRFDPETRAFTRFDADPTRPDGLSGNEIYMIQEDSRGDLWIGVKGHGLNRWSRADRELGQPKFQRLTEIDGLPSSTVYSGLWDSAGRLWLSTTRGLSRLDIDTLEFRNYHVSHGLQGEEFNLAAALRAADGQLFFGGPRGFNAFDPEQISSSPARPQVVITEFSSLNKPVSLGTAAWRGDRLELSHDQYVIGFKFAALDFAAPASNRYAYKLDGLDEDWIDAGKKREVTYTNLPWGEYAFRVRASNSEGLWSEQDAVLELYMRPAPWNTWFAWVTYLALLVLLVAVLYRSNTRRVRNAAKLRHADELAVIQSRLNEAQRIAKIGNWDWNTVTNELWWSDEIYSLFQMDPKAFGATYEAFLDRVHPDDREAVQQAVSRALDDKEPYSIDHRVLRTDGSVRIVHERGRVFFDDAGKPIRMAGTVHDVSERKRAEHELRRRADFQTMLAGLSSDLIQAQPEDFDALLAEHLQTAGLYFNLDLIGLWSFNRASGRFELLNRWARTPNKKHPLQYSFTDIPWITGQLSAGDTVVIDDMDQLPAAALGDEGPFKKIGVKSLLIIPLMAEGETQGACAFSVFREKRRWSKETITELRLVAENLLSAVARSKAVAQLKDLKEKLHQENLYLREEVRLVHGFDEIVGEDRRLRECLQAVEKVAPTDVSVLLQGETGTGKELFARAVHRLSSRRDGPLVSVNCPALPADLIESELFGHEKGAFTGAQVTRQGRFELADNGTLFLDEIGELPLELQSKLLRVLQTGGFERLGGSETIVCDVRLIAATNRDLFVAQQRGEFRSDLYYRISSFPITLPPLRERKGDIPLLAGHFAKKHAARHGKEITSISAKMLRDLDGYVWPGNVRELESIIERALITAGDGAVLELPDALPKPGRIVGSTLYTPDEEIADLDEVERAHIVRVLESAQWKISGAHGAAAMLSVPPSTLRSKMKRLGISRHKS